MRELLTDILRAEYRRAVDEGGARRRVVGAGGRASRMRACCNNHCLPGEDGAPCADRFCLAADVRTVVRIAPDLPRVWAPESM